VLGVGVEQPLGRLVAFASEAGGAPALRHRGLLDSVSKAFATSGRLRRGSEDQ